MTDEERDAKGKFIDNQSKFIMSQGFDAVTILASRYDKNDDTTSYWTRGDGNFMARFGQVKEWLLREEGKMANGEGRIND